MNLKKKIIQTLKNLIYHTKLLILILSFITTPLNAKKPINKLTSRSSTKLNPNLKLSDYLLTSKELRKLKPVDRTKYFILLYHLIATIEIIENAPKSSEIASYSNPSSKMNLYSALKTLLEQNAYAKEEIIFQTHWDINNFINNLDEDLRKTALDLNSEKQYFDKMAENMKSSNSHLSNQYKNLSQQTSAKIKSLEQNTPKTNFNENILTYNLHSDEKVRQMISVIDNTEIKNRAEELRLRSIKHQKIIDNSTDKHIKETHQNQKMNVDKQLASLINFNINEEPVSATSAIVTTSLQGTDNSSSINIQTSEPQLTTSSNTNTNIQNLRQPGNPCLFGMWRSVFKVMSNGKTMCTRPKESSDDNCKMKNGRPAFRCNYFDIKIDGKIPDGSCIPLVESKGLTDLTLRCTNATSKWMIDSKDKAITIEGSSYDKLTDALEYVLDGYITSKPQHDKMSFYEYCGAHSSNPSNTPQSLECNAVINLLHKLEPILISAKSITSVEDSSTVESSQ